MPLKNVAAPVAKWGFEKITGKKIDVNPLDIPYLLLQKQLKKEGDTAQQTVDDASKTRGDWYKKYTTVTKGIGGAIPNAAMVLFTGGTSGAAALAGEGSSLSSAVLSKLGSMAKNPAFDTSFAQSTGSAYKEAIESGATPEQAALASTLSGLLQAGVEGTGGIETLPASVKKGGTKAVVEWVKSMLSEGKEEVVQGVIDRMTAKAVYNKNAPYLPNGTQNIFKQPITDTINQMAADQSAVFNPVTAAQEFGGGVAIAGLLGGGQVLTQSALNRIGTAPRNTELNTDSNTIDSIVTPQDGVLAAQQAEDKTPAQTQIAPQANADGAILRAREMWRQGNPASAIFNETGKIVRNDGSVYSESGELQMNPNGDIMSPEGVNINAEDEGRYNKVNTGTHGQGISELRRQETDGRGNMPISGGMDQQSGKGWTSLDTGTSKQLTDTFARYVNADPDSELAILKNAFIKQYGSEDAAVSEMAKRFYEDLSMSPVIAENRWGNFIPELPELVDSFNRLIAQHSGTQTTPEGMGAMSVSTYELLSDPRALKLLEKYNNNVPKTEAEKQAELTRLYEDLFAEQQAGKTAVEKDTGQGYNGNWDRLYDENVQGTGDDVGRTAEGAGEIKIPEPPKPASLSDVDARKWYIESEAKIPNLIDKTRADVSRAGEAARPQRFNLHGFRLHGSPYF